MSKKSRMAQAFREIELLSGDAAERYFDDALTERKNIGELPSWILGWTKTEKWSELDRSGVDFIIDTVKGGIKIDIKSSVSYAKIFQHTHPADITPVVVNLFENKKVFVGRFITTLRRIYTSM